MKKEAGGASASAEVIGGAAAIVLSIIALCGGLPVALMSITTIVLGASFVLDAAAMSARYERLLGEAWGAQPNVRRTEHVGGLSAETIAGVTGIVLGILSLIGINPHVLSAVALIVFGAALLFSAGIKQRFAAVSARHAVPGSESLHHVAHGAAGLTAGGDVLIGLGAIVLGILALIGIVSDTLILVGYLGVGFLLMMSGSTMGLRLFRRSRHQTPAPAVR
jgi:hypothetical protein